MNAVCTTHPVPEGPIQPGEYHTVCAAISAQGFICTLPEDHRLSLHVAEGDPGDVLATWPTRVGG